MSQTQLLIVHPDPSARALMASMLRSLGHRITEAACDRTALRMVEQDPPSLVLSAVEPTDPDALELLGYVRRKHPDVRTILLFPLPHAERTRDALQRGAFSVLRFPVAANHLRAAVSQALEEAERPAACRGTNGHGNGDAHTTHTNGHHDTLPLHHVSSSHIAAVVMSANQPQYGSPAAAGSASKAPEFPSLIGEDPCLRQVIELAATIAPTRAPVLILGERGTGKTVLARVLHARSPRNDGPFVEVSCATVKEGALEMELFGRSGDGTDRPGKVAFANGGTLYLDEVSALSPALQVKLLRLIQDGNYEPAGSHETLHADVRVVVATREDLSALVEEGLFRQDLYYRLSVVTLKPPPLRHRGSDIERLAEHFRSKFTREVGKNVIGFAPDALEALRTHEWPGNVLELENAVERGVILCRTGRIERSHLALASRSAPGRNGASQSRPHMAMGILPLKEALEGPERQLILQALEALNWNRQETARVLDINRTTLYKKMKKYGLLIEEPAWVS
jgi:DNA-binding NtrC family response regulator